MTVAHGHLTTRIAWIDNEQVVVGVAQAGDTSQLDLALGLPIGDTHAPDIDEIEIATTTVPIGVDFGAVGGHGGIRSWWKRRRDALVQGTGRDGNSLLDSLGE